MSARAGSVEPVAERGEVSSRLRGLEIPRVHQPQQIGIEIEAAAEPGLEIPLALREDEDEQGRNDEHHQQSGE